jgi:hypothetical protein
MKFSNRLVVACGTTVKYLDQTLKYICDGLDIATSNSHLAIYTQTKISIYNVNFKLKREIYSENIKSILLSKKYIITLIDDDTPKFIIYNIDTDFKYQIITKELYIYNIQLVDEFTILVNKLRYIKYNYNPSPLLSIVKRYLSIYNINTMEYIGN